MLANRVVSLLFPSRSHKVLPPTPGGCDSVLEFAPGSVSLRVDGLPPPALDKVGTALSAPYPDRVLGLGQGLNGIWLGPPGGMPETPSQPCPSRPPHSDRAAEPRLKECRV